MNEKIKKLAADARGQMNVLTTVDEDQWEQSEEFVEKFAELVIRECSNVAMDNLDSPASAIETHFGVE